LGEKTQMVGMTHLEEKLESPQDGPWYYSNAFQTKHIARFVRLASGKRHTACFMTGVVGSF